MCKILEYVNEYLSNKWMKYKDDRSKKYLSSVN